MYLSTTHQEVCPEQAIAVKQIYKHHKVFIRWVTGQMGCRNQDNQSSFTTEKILMQQKK